MSKPNRKNPLSTAESRAALRRVLAYIRPYRFYVAASLLAAKASTFYSGRLANMADTQAVGSDTVVLTLVQPDSLFGYLLDLPILKAAGMEMNDVMEIITAVGNHEEQSGTISSAVKICLNPIRS